MPSEVLFGVLAAVISVLLGIVIFLQRRKETSVRNERMRPPPPQVRDGGAQLANRAAAGRNARARMRAQQARHEDEDTDEETSLGENIALPEGKIGKKKMAKLQAKAEKRAMREAEEQEREERKKREEKEAEQRRKEELRQEQEEQALEEAARKEREEKEQREQEEYERMKASFAVEEEGFDEVADDDQETNLLAEFVNHIKSQKVVLLEELAAHFRLKTQAAIDRINSLLEDGNLTGVIDDRGKFIFISMEELEGVAKFIRQRGRVSIAELADASNTLITLTPETAVAT